MLCASSPTQNTFGRFPGMSLRRSSIWLPVRVLELVYKDVVVEAGDLNRSPAAGPQEPERVLDDALVVRLRCPLQAVAVSFEHGSRPHEVWSARFLAELAQLSGTEEVFLGAEHQVVDLADGGGPVEGARWQAPGGGVLVAEYVRDERPLLVGGHDLRRAAQS